MSTETQRSSAKAKILDAALNVIRTKGYSATTVDDLCESAGVTKGAFFHHFKSKEAMAVSAAQHWSAITNEVFAGAAYQKIADPLEKLLAYIDFRKVLLAGEVPEFTCLVGTMVQEVHDTSPAIREACFNSIFGHAADVGEIVAAAKARHAASARWSAKSLSLHIQSVIQGSFILAKASHDSKIAAESLDHLRRYIELLFSSQSKEKK